MFAISITIVVKSGYNSDFSWATRGPFCRHGKLVGRVKLYYQDLKNMSVYFLFFWIRHFQQVQSLLGIRRTSKGDGNKNPSHTSTTSTDFCPSGGRISNCLNEWRECHEERVTSQDLTETRSFAWNEKQWLNEQTNKQTNIRLNKRTNKQTNEQANEHAVEQTNKQTNARTNERTNERTSKQTYGWTDERKDERTNKQTNERTNKQTNIRLNKRTNKQMKNERTNEQTNKQTNIRLNRRTKRRTNKQMNEQTNKTCE